MPDFLVRNLDAELVERLRSQAKAHGRSMQAEAQAILEDALPVKMTMSEWLEMVREHRSHYDLTGAPHTREILDEMYAEQEAEWEATWREHE